MKMIDLLEREQLKKDLPDFRVGDTVRVSVRILEGEKTRLQGFEGVVIRKRGSGLRATFTVRRVAAGEGVERIFPLHAPSIERIQVIERGSVRRATLYYLRKRLTTKV